MKELKPVIPALGHNPRIDLSDYSQFYYTKPIHEEWQQREDRSGEYKDHVYYSLNADLVLDVISKGYAELIERKQAEPIEYYVKMRHNY